MLNDRAASGTGPRKKADGPSQLMELFLTVSDALGLDTDRALADLAGVSVENVANWRSGAVQEFKPQKLRTIREGLAAHIAALKSRGRSDPSGADPGLCSLEVELGSGPADLLKQLRDRVSYDYLGHRFLYFDPPGALAWENLIRAGYDQDLWLSGVEACADAWLDPTKDATGHAKGPIAEALGTGQRARPAGLDVVTLGPGDGAKELAFLKKLVDLGARTSSSPAWLAFALVDVSIPLLLTAATEARRIFASTPPSDAELQIRAFCADFEEGRLSFVSQLPTHERPGLPGVRLVVMLGNTFGNLRDEETFVRQKLWTMTRPGDLVWLEVGLRAEPIETDPLYRLTLADREETSGEANRRLLLEGPYRRWEAATGRKPSEIDMRVWIREDDDASRVPGSYNFCHDLVLKDERRVCTMLYSRRYQLEGLTEWLGRLRFEVLRISRVEDAKKRPRACHLLLRRRS